MEPYFSITKDGTVINRSSFLPPMRKIIKPRISKLVHYTMAERCAEEMIEHFRRGEACTREQLHNFIVALTTLTYYKYPYGPKVDILYHDLEALYVYDDADKKLEGFDLGAIYGATQFYDKYLKLKEES